MKKRKLIIILSVIGVILVISCIVILLIINNKKIEVSSNSKPITTELKIKENIEVDLNSNILPVSKFFNKDVTSNDYVINYYQNGELVYLKDKYDALGEYEVLITIDGKDYSTTLTIKDLSSPNLEVKDLEINKNSEYSIEDFVVSCTDNSNESCILNFDDEKMATYEDEGEYKIVINASDTAGNKVTKEVMLIISSTDKTTNTNNKDDTSSNTNKPNNENKPADNNSDNSTYKEYAGTYSKIREETNSYKYGLIEITKYIDDYIKYTDGTEELSKTTVLEKEYDYSGYNGTTDTLKPEALSNASKYSAKVNEILNLVNDIRTKEGVAPLSLDTTLTTMAMIRSLEISYGGNVSHYRPDGSLCFTIGNEFGFNFNAENVAAGQSTPSRVVSTWDKSPGHHANMVDASFTKMGVGIAYFNDTYYWVQIFSY